MASSAAYEILNDLVHAHRDRIADYEKATLTLKPQEAGLSTTFSEIIKESQQCISDITNRTGKSGYEGSVATQSQQGKTYGVWTSVRAKPLPSANPSVLDTCERTEDALLKTYSNVLLQKELFSTDDFSLLSSQEKALRETHDLIRTKRNAYHELVKNNQII